MNVSVDEPESLELLELGASELGAFSELVAVEPMSAEPMEPSELSVFSAFPAFPAFSVFPVLSVLVMLKESPEGSVLGAC
jgi:hypothetical protein